MSKLPKGWSSYDPKAGRDGRPVSCDNCDWKGVAEDLDEIDDLYCRVDGGEIMPAGQCPAIVVYSDNGETGPCGCLVHYSDVIVAFREAPNILEKIVEATE